MLDILNHVIKHEFLIRYKTIQFDNIENVGPGHSSDIRNLVEKISLYIQFVGKKSMDFLIYGLHYAA